MDPFVIGFYAIVCGVLGWAAPTLGRASTRLGVGVVVGVVAASTLPFIRTTLGL